MNAKLTLRQQAFVTAYLGESPGNATQAAITAGYSPRTACAQGSRLLKHVEVQKALQRHLDASDVRTDAVLRRLKRIVDSEPEKVTGADVIGASKLILQVNGALDTDKPAPPQQNYYFGSLEALMAMRRNSPPAIEAEVMASPVRVSPVSGDNGR